ncbi:hypothetical protein M3625_20735 [Paenibacillus sp. MER 78]|nr:hypothetical protein [Paenibacillus sp. MER 78]
MLEEIAARLDDSNPNMENPISDLRLAFKPGESTGDQFIALLHRAAKLGLISGVSFVYRYDGVPDDAVWTGARLLLAGENLLRRSS